MSSLESILPTEAPCEVCDSQISYDDDDRFEDDLYRTAREGTRAREFGYRFRRICGRRRTEREEEVEAFVEREEEMPEPPVPGAA